MKVKDFKTQLKNEHLNIPNVLNNIKNIAYNAEFKQSIKESNFNFNKVFKYSISFCLLLIIGIFVIPNLGLFNPGGAVAESAIPKAEQPEQDTSNFDSISTYEIDIYSSYYENNYHSDIELFENIEVSGNTLLKAKFDEVLIIILNYEIFNHLRLYIHENNGATFENCLNEIYITYGLNEEYYETIYNAYKFIIEKDQ